MTVQVKEAAAAAREIPRSAWTTYSGVAAYVCRASIKQAGSKFSATSLRRPDLVTQGDSAEEAMEALKRVFKSAAVARAAIKPIKEISTEEMLQAVSALVLVDDAERRNAIIARIPPDDELALIARDDEPLE